MAQLDATRLGDELDARLAAADAALAARFPGDRAGRQPIHTVYVPADRFDAELCPAWGAQAISTLDEHHGLVHRARRATAATPTT